MRHMTKEERRLMGRWHKEKVSNKEIAKRLGRDPSTIGREFTRNSGKRGYRADQAQKKAEERSKRSGHRKFTDEIIQDIHVGLLVGFTPEIISCRARYEGRPHVCKESIYQYIYQDASVGGELWRSLPRAKRKRKRRCPRDENHGRGRILNQRKIADRPKEVETRTTLGHWEGDLINGAHGTGNLVTIVERRSRFTLVGKTETKQASEVLHEMRTLISGIPKSLRCSLTLDNGKEFAYHETLEKKTGIAVYFANAYHSWERGTSENTNGLIRRLHPKKRSFEKIGLLELMTAEQYVNDRPRKCLGWRTPREVFEEAIVAAP